MGAGDSAGETNKGLKRSASVDPFKGLDVNLGRHGFLYHPGRVCGAKLVLNSMTEGPLNHQ